jgi:UDP-N-acetyl-D-glucosamine dehydrogenase
VIGLGYVGLPLAQTILQKGFSVVGLDTDREKVKKLQEGTSYNDSVSDQFIRKSVQTEQFVPTTDESSLDEVDIILICVPTPLNEDRTPDLEYIEQAARTTRDHLQTNQLIVLESTTYPGTTEELLVPILEESGLDAGRDFYVAYAPERIDPGNQEYKTDNTPRVVGGLNDTSTLIARDFYQEITVGVVSVDRPREAEATKLLENIYRSINIALVNELKELFQDMDVNIWNVIEAAKTKPFGFEAFYPGPGLGGHCLPIDPYLLAWKARQVGQEARMVELAGEINTGMPEHIVRRIDRALSDRNMSLSTSDILVLGAAYKENVGDLRESPALALFNLLEGAGAHVDYHDPHVPEIKPSRNYSGEKTSIDGYPEAMSNYDAVVVCTAHSEYDPQEVLHHAKLIFDTRNLMGDLGRKNDRVLFV